jgi:CRP-like cAMP-binding protein
MTDIHIFKSSPDAVDVAAGETLFSEGDDGDVMFAVVEGEVELTHQGRVVEEVAAGGILGEMALIDTGPRSATATARTAAHRPHRSEALHVPRARAPDVRPAGSRVMARRLLQQTSRPERQPPASRPRGVRSGLRCGAICSAIRPWYESVGDVSHPGLAPRQPAGAALTGR